MEYKAFPSFTDWGLLPYDFVELWSQNVAQLRERQARAKEEDLKQALSIPRRAAAVDTGAIEGLYSTDRGFTMSVAREVGSWREEFQAKGEEAKRLFDAQLSSLNSVIDDAATKRLPITEAWIRALHEHICEPQETHRVLTPQGLQDHVLVKGAYKEEPNNPVDPDSKNLRHVYAPPAEVEREMHRLVEELGCARFDHAVAPLQASYAHYALVSVHPFADGNGRVARALASVFLIRSASIPFLLFADQKSRYLDSLELADQGDYRPINMFFADRSIDAIQLVSNALVGAETPALGAVASRLRYLFASPGDLTVSELDALARRVLTHVQSSIQQRFDQLSLPDTIRLQTSQAQADRMGAPLGYRRVLAGRPGPSKQEGLHLSVRLAVREPVPLSVQAIIRVLVAMGGDVPSPILIEFQLGEEVDKLSVSLDNVQPELSRSLNVQLQQVLEHFFGRMLGILEERVMKAREESR